MKQLVLVCVLLTVFVTGIMIFKDALLYKFDRTRVDYELIVDSTCDAKKITEIVNTFVTAYNEGQIETSTDYFSQDFQWFSDTELVHGEKISHFASFTQEEFSAHFQTQYELGQTIHITHLEVNGGWHGGADISYKGKSKTANGMGVLTGKGMIDCQTDTIAVWSMATHFPNLMSSSTMTKSPADIQRR